MVKKFIFYFEKSDFLVDMEIYRYNHDTVELGDDIWVILCVSYFYQ